MASHLSWSNHLVWRKYRSNLRVQCIEKRRGETLRLDRVRHPPRCILFRFHQNKNWNMARVRLRPASHVTEARNESVAGAPLVDILDVHHLKSWLIHLMLRIEVRVCRQSRCRHAANNCWMSKPPALGVGKNIDLNL